MAKAPPPSVEKIIKSQWMVEFERKHLDEHKLRGFVLDCSDILTLIHLMDDNFYLNGYTIIRNEDVTKYWVYDKQSYFVSRALNIKNLKPIQQPEVEIGCWHNVLSTASNLFPLITIHREEMNNEVCYIGRLVEITSRTFTLQEIDTTALWEGNRRFRFNDVTRIDFGGGYEEVLALVAAEGEKKKKGK